MAARPDEANGSGGQARACVGLKPAESGGVGAAQRYAWLENLLPPVEEVRPGLWSIPVPWPRSGLRYTLSYLVSGRGGPALIDTGWPTEEAWSALADSITQTGHDIAEIRYVLVTHAHADHLGLAGRVREASGALVGMHPAESATLLHRVGPQAWRERLSGWLRSRGAPDDQVAEITDLMAGAVAFHARLARSDFDVEHDGLPLGAGTGLRAVWTPGHTPGHLCFYDEQQDVLLTGDHVLPRITPHIGLPPGAEGDPLGDYQASLRDAGPVQPGRGAAGARVPVRRSRRPHRGAALAPPDPAGGDRARRRVRSRPVDVGRLGGAELVARVGADPRGGPAERRQRDVGAPAPPAGAPARDQSGRRPRRLVAGATLFGR